MTDIIQAKKTAPLGYHYTNAGILPNEWTSRPLSSIVEEITETAGTRKIEVVSIGLMIAQKQLYPMCLKVSGYLMEIPISMSNCLSAVS